MKSLEVSNETIKSALIKSKAETQKFKDQADKRAVDVLNLQTQMISLRVTATQPSEGDALAVVPLAVEAPSKSQVRMELRRA